ncbi:uncharacterized protein G2W53_036854 [Senna tora]|uniref:Uncharacterized protein n=1 Tax=Senna tora TaxID=362788 RepID=A0A834W934_9FABA|nr:uncharacterized protein G2W53_036854 [Senna tora]
MTSRSDMHRVLQKLGTQDAGKEEAPKKCFLNTEKFGRA